MKRTFLFVAILTIVLLLAACGGSSEPAPTLEPQVVEAQVVVETVVVEVTKEVVVEKEVGKEVEVLALPEVNPLEVSGDIIVAGSSTVFPLSERMAERFRDEGYADNITIDSIGSGAGFERFCVAGESDISNASRPIKDKEVANCQAIGREPIEIRVGTDALAVVVSNENDFVESATFDELALLFSGDAELWSDVNASWPGEPIQRFIPGTDSGTFDFFVEEVFDKDAEKALGAKNQQLSEDDNVLVRGILGSPYAIGYFGYAYYAENADALKVLSIESVEPNDATVDSGDYPLARPLFMYTTASIMQEKPQVADFVNFYLTNVNDEVSDVGYFPASTDDLNAAKQAWLNVITGGVQTSTGGEMQAGAIELPSVNPLEVSGDIIAAGSSTVFPLSERMAERFRDEGYADNITIDSIGSGAGFERFCVAGESDISNASRPIKDKEVANCQAIGREPIEIRVGTDALAVVVSNENDFVESATFDELALLFSGDAELWSDVNASWPGEPIQRFIPGTDSGTFDFFVEEVFDKDAEKALGAKNQQLSEDDNVLVRGILGSPYAIGYFGYAYYAENADALKVLSIESVEPNDATVDSGDYPLARPLFMYTTASIMQEKPQVADFVNFYLTNVNDEVTDVGYFPASTDDLNAAKQAWLAANQ